MLSLAVPPIHEPSRSTAAGDFKRLNEALGDLYERQRREGMWNEYLDEHCRPRCIENQVRTFQWYRQFLPDGGVVLDWGCQHAPDSCLLRFALGDRFERHRCDFGPARKYCVFAEYADAKYTELGDVYRIPYPTGTFDAVIASGTLEHVAMDYESLKELHRILKPGGVLIGSYLPNRLSIAEWRQRVVRKRHFHDRLYHRREVVDMLKHTGFAPRVVDHHTFVWDRLLNKIGMSEHFPTLKLFINTFLPVHHFCATLRFVAKRVEWF